MIEFIFLNRDIFKMGGLLFIVIGLFLMLVTDVVKLKSLQIMSSIICLIGGTLLGSLIIVSLYSKEYTVMKILKQKPNLKKEYLMKYDIKFLDSILMELDVKRKEKNQKEIQEIINQ